MTDPKDGGVPAEGRESTRRRGQIYGDRTTVSLRMDPALHARMMNLCDELKTPANRYLLGLIEADLRKRKK